MVTHVFLHGHVLAREHCAGAAGGETAFEASLEEAYSFRPGQVQPDTGVDKSCLINTIYPPPYHFQNLIRSFAEPLHHWWHLPAHLVELTPWRVNFAQADTIVF